MYTLRRCSFKKLKVNVKVAKCWRCVNEFVIQKHVGYSIHVKKNNEDKWEQNIIMVKEEKSGERYIEFQRSSDVLMKLGENVFVYLFVDQ